MNKIVAWTCLMALAALLAALSFFRSDWLSDENKFLANFVNHELLATLGFIAAVTLASAASLHLELNRLEDSTNQGFPRTRRSICQSAYSLLIGFGISVILVVVKPLLPSCHNTVALANSFALLILYFYLVVMWDLTAAVLGVPTIKQIREIQGRIEPPASRE